MLTLVTLQDCSVPQGSAFIAVVQSVLTWSRSSVANVAAALLLVDLQSNCPLATTTDSSFGIITIRQSTVIMRELLQVSTSFLSAVLLSIALEFSHFTDIGQISSPRFDGGVINGLQMLHVCVKLLLYQSVRAKWRNHLPLLLQS